MSAFGCRVGLLATLGVAVFCISWIGGACANSWGIDRSIAGLLSAQLFLTLCIAHSKKLNLPALRWGKGIVNGLGLGIVALVVSMPLTGLWSWALEKCGVEAVPQAILTKIGSANLTELLIIGVVAGLWGPYVEEAYFRGWWQPVLAGKFGDIFGIIVVALAFAFLHGNIAILPGLWVAGCLFGYAAKRWGLASAVAAHGVFNCATIIAALAIKP